LDVPERAYIWKDNEIQTLTAAIGRARGALGFPNDSGLEMNVAAATASVSSLNAADPVVLLVDDKIRDLNVAALIAHHLKTLGVTCHLEPLEAFRAVLGAYRPGMVVFNHLNASHLVEWSRRLADIGVLTAVLPNEGLAYHEQQRAFLSGRFHQSHTDYFFCWNEMHAQSVRQERANTTTQVEVVGVPRFDFYFKPWSKILPSAPPRQSQRPRVLFCTNFGLARFADDPKAADALFGNWAEKSPANADYKGAIASQLARRRKVLEILEILVDDGRFEILLRPHPRESRVFYQQWLDSLPVSRRAGVVFDPDNSITSLILDCDLQISCESCTTTLESWTAGKPTISLVFDRHPLLYREKQAAADHECEDPATLPDMIVSHLAAPEQPERREQRARHLATWCATPKGLSAYRIAKVIADAVREKRPSNWSKLTANDYRRAIKLRMTRQLGLAYHYNPALPLKSAVFGDRYALKRHSYEKAIKPRDVAAAARWLDQVGSDSSTV
jgi:surface carbohydrate biosynthesis protein